MQQMKKVLNFSENITEEPIIYHLIADYGVRVNILREERGAKRAVKMLLAKISGRPYETELPLPVFDRSTPAPAVADPGRALLALVTDGGVVPAAPVYPRNSKPMNHSAGTTSLTQLVVGLPNSRQPRYSNTAASTTC